MAPQTDKIKDSIQTDEDEPEEMDEEYHRRLRTVGEGTPGEDQVKQQPQTIETTDIHRTVLDLNDAGCLTI